MTGWQFAREGQPFLIAGPCVVEPNEVLFRIADRLVEIGRRLGIPVCFKASFDKANRSGIDAARGPGIDEGLRRSRGCAGGPGCHSSLTCTSRLRSLASRRWWTRSRCRRS